MLFRELSYYNHKIPACFCEVHALHLICFHKNGLFLTEELELTLPPPRVPILVGGEWGD